MDISRLVYKVFELFTDTDVYKFLIWVPKLHAPKTDNNAQIALE